MQLLLSVCVCMCLCVYEINVSIKLRCLNDSRLFKVVIDRISNHLFNLNKNYLFTTQTKNTHWSEPIVNPSMDKV